MTCDDFEAVVVDLARGRSRDARTRERAGAHVARCEECARRLAREQGLTAALTLVAERDARRGAPARVEQDLRRAFRAHWTNRPQPPKAPAPARRGHARTWASAAAVAAGLAAWAVVFAGRTREAPAPADADLALAARTADFIPIRYGPALSGLDAVEIVHVRLPRSAATSLGWPEDVRAGTESVEADVIVGHDGVARAIRFAAPEAGAGHEATAGGQAR